MRTVKFTSNDDVQKEFGKTVRKNVNLYSKEKGKSTKGNAEMYVNIIMMLIIYIALVILTTPLNLSLAIFLVILMGIGEAGIGMSVMYDASHG